MKHGLQGRTRQQQHGPEAICINRTLIKKRLLVEFSCEHPTRYPIKRFTACTVIYLCDKWLPQHHSILNFTLVIELLIVFLIVFPSIYLANAMIISLRIAFKNLTIQQLNHPILHLLYLLSLMSVLETMSQHLQYIYMSTIGCQSRHFTTQSILPVLKLNFLLSDVILSKPPIFKKYQKSLLSLILFILQKRSSILPYIHFKSRQL